MSALRTRDLASHDLWERSLHRSRERRRIAAIHRKNAPRRKGISLAVSAALLTTPVFTPFAAAAGGGGPAPTSDTGGDGGDPGHPVPPRSLLKIGSTGDAVRKIQQALGLIDDGIYGPQTREAVLRFQRHAKLAPTGKVDNGTWMAIFAANVTVLDAGTPEAAAVQSAAGDVPLAPAVTTSTEPATIRDEDPGAASPAEFVQDDTGSTPKRGTRKRDRGDSSSRPRRSRTRTRSERDDSSSRTPSPNRDTSSDNGGDSNSSSCGGTLRRPVNGPVTGVFGEPRGGGRSHAGNDIAAPAGTPIKAATCGTVTTMEYQGGYGNIVCIRANATFTTCYAHMSRFGTSVGKYVRIGEVIGYVGCTGNCTGPHVHFEVRLNGTAVDPAPYLNGSRKPPGRSMAVRYESAHKKGASKKKSKPEGTEAIVREQRDANREAGGVPAPPEPTPEQQQPTQAAPPAPGQPAPTAPAAAPEQAAPPADDGSGVVDDTTPGVDDTVDTTTGGDDGSGTTDPAVTGDGSSDDGSGVVDDTTGTVEDTTGVDTSTGDGSSDDGSSDDGSGVVDDTTGTVDDTTGTVDDTIGVDTSSDDGSSDDGSGVVDDTTGTVEDTSGQDTSGSEDPASGDTSSDDSAGDDGSGAEDPASGDTSSGDTTGQDTSGSEDTSSGDDGSGAGDPAADVTEDPAGTVQDTVEDTTGAPVGG